MKHDKIALGLVSIGVKTKKTAGFSLTCVGFLAMNTKIVTENSEINKQKQKKMLFSAVQ